MNTERIKEIQQETAYPDSIGVQQALLKVWNECEQEKAVKNNAVLPHVSDMVCDHRYHSRNGRSMLYEGWCEKCGTDISQTGR